MEAIRTLMVVRRSAAGDRTAGFEPVKAGGIGQSGRLEVGGDLHGLVVGSAEARSLIGAA